MSDTLSSQTKLADPAKQQQFQDNENTLGVLKNLDRFVRKASYSGEDAVDVVNCLEFIGWLKHQIETNQESLKKEMAADMQAAS